MNTKLYTTKLTLNVKYLESNLMAKIDYLELRIKLLANKIPIYTVRQSILN